MTTKEFSLKAKFAMLTGAAAASGVAAVVLGEIAIRISLAAALGLSNNFPTAGQFLEQTGRDPSIVAQLSDRAGNLRMRDVTTLRGYLHAYAESRTRDTPVSSETSIHLDRTFADQNLYLIDFPQKNAPSLKNMIIDATDVSPELVEHMPLTDEEIFYMIISHEISHSRSDNDDLMTMLEDKILPSQRLTLEYRADQRAADFIATYLDKPEIKTAWMHYRALLQLVDPLHATAILMARRAANQPLPDLTDALAAQKKIADLATTLLTIDPDNLAESIARAINPATRTKTDAAFYRKYGQTKPWNTGLKTDGDFRLAARLESYYRILHVGVDVEPLVAEQARLYLDGVEYFMPTLAKRVKDHVVSRYPATPRPSNHVESPGVMR